MHASLHLFDTGGELIVWGMPEPPIGEVYEVWLNHASGPPQPTDALFTVTSAGEGTVEVPGPLLGVHEVLVTSEPLGGSSAPTSAAVLRLRVGQAH
jgi:Anti-sigma-K factor rskA